MKNSSEMEELLGRMPIRLEHGAIRESLRERVVLVTGAAGSIGSEISRQVAACAPRLLVLLDQAESPVHALELEMAERAPGVPVVMLIGDVTRAGAMRRIFERYRPQVVYHAAAYKHVPLMERHPEAAVAVNVGGTRVMADLAVAYGAERFVMISTDKAVNPTNVMGASKRIAEIYVQSHPGCREPGAPPTRFITTRFGNVLGSNGSVVPLFRRQIAQGGPVTVTHRDIIRYFMTIGEACSLVLEAGRLGAGGEIFVFDMGEPVRIYDLARRMIRRAGLRPGTDIEIRETGLRPGEKLYEELLCDGERDLPTSHPQIRIARVRPYDPAQAASDTDRLLALAENGARIPLVREMMRIVPEFVSGNPEFSAVDQCDFFRGEI